MKLKKSLCLFLAIFTMFFMIDGVNALNFTDSTTISNKETVIQKIKSNKKGNLSYYVSNTYDSDHKNIENKHGYYSDNNPGDPTHGSINIFGFDGDTIYESSVIDAHGLSGIFPVIIFDNGNELTADLSTALYDKYLYLSTNTEQTALIGEFTDSTTNNKITVTVTPSHVWNNQFIKLNYVAKNNGTTNQVISMAGYSDTSLNGIDNASENPSERILSNEKGFKIESTTTDKKIKKMYVITDNFTGVVNNKDINYWIGNRKINTINNQYLKAFKSSSNIFDTKNTEKDSAMAFSWNNITLKPGEEVTRSILIGLGDITPLVDASGNTEFNLETDKEININVQYIVPVDGEKYKLYYKLNDQQTPTVVEDADLTKRVDATKILNLIDSDDLNKACDGKNVLTAWIGPADNSSLDSAVVSDTHEFAIVCTVQSEQLGVNTNYLILGLILVGGIGVYVYGRKHNKFPQV